MQEVIVYRNPMEAAFWNAVTEHPEFFLFVIVAAIVFVGTMRVVECIPMVARLKYMVRNRVILMSGVFTGLTTLFAMVRYF